MARKKETPGMRGGKPTRSMNMGEQDKLPMEDESPKDCSGMVRKAMNAKRKKK